MRGFQQKVPVGIGGRSVTNISTTAKRQILNVGRDLGLFRLFGHSSTRRKQLLILSYHGISSGEAHHYNPFMFMPVVVFERRMQILRDTGANIVSLAHALTLLSQGRLQPRSVVITFDDGWADFQQNANPILKRYSMPATVYLTTAYCLNNKPIFLLALDYMMWKRGTEVIENPGLSFLPSRLDLTSYEKRTAFVNQFDEYAKREDLSIAQRNDLCAEFASMIGFDYQALLRQRLFNLMTPSEVADVARGGVDIQLHTHNHRPISSRDDCIGEINDNRRCITEITGVGDCVVHFCYPSGRYRPALLPWLQEAGVQSATISEPGLAKKSDNLLLLPRILDRPGMSESEFEAWVTGFAAILPRRKQTVPDVAPE
jgi:peptidoglycan/xylan/chitin deacetylase (PgdA/CDA1 family)